MATATATNYADMMTDIRGNLLQLSQEVAPQIDLKDRLETWKNTYFILLDKTKPEEEKAHRWIVPTIALLQELGSRTTFGGNLQTFPEIEEISILIQRTIASVAFNGSQPDAGTETAMLVAWNAVWT